MTQFSGILFALAAFVSWGFLPVYWKQLQMVSPFEILCHRIIWSCLFLCIIISFQKRWNEVYCLLKTSSQLKGLILSGLLIGFNWFIYIWAVNSGRVVESSLGYYINPMLNILIGYALLGERLSRLQFVAVTFACTGVGYSLLSYGELPLFALVLAISFAFYGYTRKKTKAAPIPGLLIETFVLFIPALAYIIYRQFSSASYFMNDLNVTLWLVGAGIATSVPLLWFASSAKKLDLSTIGILQYIAPTIAFILGVFVYKEQFTLQYLITFGLIWIGVIIYIAEALINNNKS